VDAGASNYPPSEWLADAEWELPVLLDDADDSVLNAVGLIAIPYTVVVNSDGTVAARATGAVPIEVLVELTELLS
jgi:hypothetical protein